MSHVVHALQKRASRFFFVVTIVLPQSNINSTNRFPRPCAPPEPQAWTAPGDTANAESFQRRIARAVILIAVAVMAHLFVVRAPRPSISPALPTEPVPLLSQHVAEASTRSAHAELPRVTVITKELIAQPTTGVAPPRPAKPVITGTELLAIGTSGRETLVERAGPVMPEAVHMNPSDAVSASVPDEQPVNPIRQEEQKSSTPDAAKSEAALSLSPISASRKLLANVPRSVPAVARERVIRTAPIVEPDQRPLVLSVLAQYADAFGRLDAEATKAVYPTVNYVALRRAFDQLQTQRLTFQSCETTISGRDAYARCQGEASYRPRIGRPTVRRASGVWTFDLAKADDGWQIVRASVR